MQEQQKKGNEAFLAGSVFIEGVWKVQVAFPGIFGETHMQEFGVALLEYVIPGHRKHHRGSDRARLSRTIPSMIMPKTYEPIPRIDNALTKVYRALQDHAGPKLASCARSAHPALGGLLRMVRAAARDDVWFEDVELHNVGWRLSTKPASLVLFDLGRVNAKIRLRTRLRRAYGKIPVHDLSRSLSRNWR